jgi:hemerythrin
MTDLIQWTDAYSVGVSEFDDQHRKLFALINDLFSAMKAGKGRETLATVLSGLAEYTVYHFSTEEKYFAKYGYPDSVKHVVEHKAFVARVTEFREKYNTGAILVSVETLEFLKKWIDGHIKKVDKQYTSYLQSKGVK